MIKGLDDFLDEATDKGQIVGTWGFNSNIDFSRMRQEETNVWFFEQVFYFLRAFFGLVMPDSMSVERRSLMLAYGAKFELTPREKGMKGAIEKAKEIWDKLNKIWTHQNLTWRII